MSDELDTRMSQATAKLAANPGDRGTRREFCEAVYLSVDPSMSQRVRWLVGWYQKREVEDILQTVLLNLFTKAIRLCEEGKLRPKPNPAAYLRKVAYHELLDCLRASGELPETHSTLVARTPCGQSETSPLEQLITGEIHDALRAALAKLDPVDREVIHLRVAVDLQYKDIADRFGLTPSALRTRFHRATMLLRELLRASRPGS